MVVLVEILKCLVLFVGMFLYNLNLMVEGFVVIKDLTFHVLLCSQTNLSVLFFLFTLPSILARYGT